MRAGPRILRARPRPARLPTTPSVPCMPATQVRTGRVSSRELVAEAGRADVADRSLAASAEAEAMRHLGDGAMLAALNRLPNRQREVLVLRYFADWSEASIADALGIAPGSVKAHAHRGLAALRARLEEAS